MHREQPQAYVLAIETEKWLAKMILHKGWITLDAVGFGLDAGLYKACFIAIWLDK